MGGHQTLHPSKGDNLEFDKIYP